MRSLSKRSSFSVMSFVRMRSAVLRLESGRSVSSPKAAVFAVAIEEMGVDAEDPDGEVDVDAEDPVDEGDFDAEGPDDGISLGDRLVVVEAAVVGVAVLRFLSWSSASSASKKFLLTKSATVAPRGCGLQLRRAG